MDDEEASVHVAPIRNSGHGQAAITLAADDTMLKLRRVKVKRSKKPNTVLISQQRLISHLIEIVER